LAASSIPLLLLSSSFRVLALRLINAYNMEISARHFDILLP
jgi:hypothetical protein